RLVEDRRARLRRTVGGGWGRDLGGAAAVGRKGPPPSAQTRRDQRREQHDGQDAEDEDQPDVLGEGVSHVGHPSRGATTSPGAGRPAWTSGGSEGQREPAVTSSRSAWLSSVGSDATPRRRT